MRIAVVADVHIGNHRVQGGKTRFGLNDRCRLTIETLESAYASARRAQCTTMIIAGDLFDTPTPTPQMLARVISVMRDYDDVDTIVLSGNHDQMSTSPGDNGLGPLAASDAAIVVDDGPDVMRELLLIPFAPSMTIDDLRRCVEKLPNCKIAFSHVGVEDDRTPPWLRGHGVSASDVLDLMESHGIYVWMSGDWHSAAEWRRGRHLLAQIGALCPTGYDNPGDKYGYMRIIDTSGMHTSVVPIPGPRFHSVASAAEASELAKNPNNFVRIVTDDPNAGDVELDHGNTDRITLHKKRHTADVAQYRRGSIRAAVDSYIDSSVPADDAESVRALCHRYL